jgi:hypothetical protein
MRQLAKLLLVAALFVLPATAQAGFIVEGSVGSGYQATVPTGRIPSNIMVAPGYGLGTLLRLELGLVGTLGDAQNQSFDLQLRPMIVLSPPIFPLYARAVFAVTNLLDDAQLAYGGAIGADFEVMDTVGAFAEVGVLPTKPKGADKLLWIVEARAGVYFAL